MDIRYFTDDLGNEVSAFEQPDQAFIGFLFFMGVYF